MKKIAIVGTGPAALMAASRFDPKKFELHLFERRKSAGWKLLVAGSSGLNVTHGGEESELWQFYRSRQKEMKSCLERFPRSQWLEHLESLGEKPYLGSSNRYLIANEKAASLLKQWVQNLEASGARFHYDAEWIAVDFSNRCLEFSRLGKQCFDAVLFAMGGLSWEKSPSPWPSLFAYFQFHPFEPSNAGYSINAKPEFFQAHHGSPIKGLRLTTQIGSKVGECMITRYGLEGTPIYTVGCPGEATFDLKPDLREDRLAARIGTKAESFFARAKLSKGAEALAKEFLPDSPTPEAFARNLKNVKIQLLRPQPLTESISSRGGLSWDELDENLMLKKAKGFFCAGEMVDWDAPTGGFLLQGSVSMGAVAAEGIQRLLE